MPDIKKVIEDSNLEFEVSYNEGDKDVYLLKLYVTGLTPQSLRAIQNIKEICEKDLKDRYILEVINLYEHPELAREEQVVAAPMLIRKLPLPLRKIIGNLSDKEKVLIGLDLKKKS